MCRLSVLCAVNFNSLRSSSTVTRDRPTISGNPFIDNYPHRENWTSWMLPAVETLLQVCYHSDWRDILENWLKFKHAMGYPEGQVSIH